MTKTPPGGADGAVAAIELLTQVGLRVTAPRVAVIDFFRGTERRHLTGEQVYALIRDSGVRITLPTVYRVLSQLTEVGILTRNVFENRLAVYELRADSPHDHLICMGCAVVREFHDSEIETQKRAAATAAGYTLQPAPIALYGYCASCRLKPRWRG